MSMKQEGEKNNDKKVAAKRPPLVQFQCPLICEQGPSIPSSPTLLQGPQDAITADLMQRIQMIVSPCSGHTRKTKKPTFHPPTTPNNYCFQFSSQFDSARLSPNYATSDLGSSARSSFSTSSSWMAYRDRSVDFDETGKELISPFDCDTACSVSPSFSLSPNSFHHFSERSRSESDMQPTQTDDARLLANSTISVPCYSKKPIKFGGEIKRSSSTPPPTTTEREEVEQQRLLRPTSGLGNKEDIEAANSIVSNWARDQIFAIQNASNMYNLLTARSAEDCSTLSAPGPVKVVPKSKDDSAFIMRDEASRAKQMQYPCTLCGQAFAVHDRLAKHIASRHRQRSCTLDDASKVHKCNMCPKSFARSDMLTRHMRLHTGAKPYSCPTCNQVFSRSDHLSTHLRTHTGEKPYACPLCNYSASRRDMISRHMRTHSMSDDVSTPLTQLSIRSASTSPLPPKIVDPTALVEIGSGELSAFKPILSTSLSTHHLSVSSPFQSLSLSTPSSPSFPPPTILLNRQSSFDTSMSST
ncbi:hypothetical protein CAEBREN_30915 [Caenorhabditis brenneri]|uniref:C2H2-type domain-containing protein n=1 Tax=Caenorhabditis brenneri TaxID=135651 RepID=G0NZN2_CAEBE|nr:hypothetical protein CAEBREN_30915 [Caenorhabditis brenneri]